MQTFSNGLVELSGLFRQVSKAVDIVPGNSIVKIELVKVGHASSTIAATIAREGKQSIVDTYSYNIVDGLVWVSLDIVE